MTAARVTLYDEATAFAEAVIAPIATCAVVNNVFLGVVERMTATPERDHLRAAVWMGDALALGALIKPPYSLDFAHAGRGFEGVDALAKALAAREQKVPGAGGENAIAEAFAAVWTFRTGVRTNGGEKRLLYQATEAVRPSTISGELIPTARTDLARHIAWEEGFATDVDAPPAQRESALTAKRVEGWLAKGVLFDWVVEGAPVAHGVVLPILRLTTILRGDRLPTMTGSIATGEAKIKVHTERPTLDVTAKVRGISIKDLSQHLAHAPVGPMHFHHYAAEGSSSLLLPFSMGPAYAEAPDGFVLTQTGYRYSDGAKIFGSTISFDEFVESVKAGAVVLNIHTERYEGGEISGRVQQMP